MRYWNNKTKSDAHLCSFLRARYRKWYRILVIGAILKAVIALNIPWYYTSKKSVHLVSIK
jgi:hypothetical protein